MADEPSDDRINAAPTKAFFVDMLVRDIPLEQAVLDLVDNSVDGAKRIGVAGRFDGRTVDIRFGSDGFSISDNCGGFDRQTARNYAFRFGRPPGNPRVLHSLGQFGVGMKRALFKFGRHFTVRSATKDEKWAVDVDVQKWEEDERNWSFEWADSYGDNPNYPSESDPGTQIAVDRLRPEVSAKFSTKVFENAIANLIKSKHREFIANGLSVSVNGTHLDATSVLLLLTDHLKPGVETMSYPPDPPVKVRVVVGVGSSSPTMAGWYIICNGRIILEADRRKETGWGRLEEEDERVLIPSFHNQFARFRGITWFDCEDSARVPWNTVKTDVDQDNPIWQSTFQKMMEMMRPVINFLNQLDDDIDEHSRENSPLLKHVNNAYATPVETIVAQSTASPQPFRAPARGTLTVTAPTIKIQYSKKADDIQFLQEALSVNSAKAVGEKTFDLILRKQRGE